MHPRLSTIIRSLRATRRVLTSALEHTLMIAVVVLVVAVLWGVFSRYMLGHQAGWTEELARMTLIWVSMLGASLAFSTRGHLGVDALVNQMTPSAQRFMAVLAHLLVIFFAASIMLWGGTHVTLFTFQLDQQLMALHFPKGFVYLAVPVSGLFIILFSVEAILETIVGEAPPERAP